MKKLNENQTIAIIGGEVCPDNCVRLSFLEQAYGYQFIMDHGWWEEFVYCADVLDC
jgi:hypothetical protein